MLIRVRNVHKQPLDDIADIDVSIAGTDKAVRRIRDASTQKTIRLEKLKAGEAYKIKVFPHRHRPVGQFAMIPMSGEAAVEVVCPVHPERARVVFPPYGKLNPGLKTILQSSLVEGLEQKQGKALYDALADLPKAGLMNVYAKSNRTLLPDGSSVASHFKGLYRVRTDRIFVDVDVPLRDLVKSAIDGGSFDAVSGALHTPPPDFSSADSFKTNDHYGNLQLSFFVSQQSLDFKVDSDIDDANGIEHVFQVLRNWITHGTTHPYDIHEILVYYQHLEPGYDLDMKLA
jgi:hypothetical protein